MTSPDRVLSALRLKQPDRVPYCEVGVSGILLRALEDGPSGGALPGGIDEMDARGPESEVRISKLLGRDNVCFRLHPPVPAASLNGAYE